MQFKHLRTTAALACGGGMIALALTGCNANGKASMASGSSNPPAATNSPGDRGTRHHAHRRPMKSPASINPSGDPAGNSLMGELTYMAPGKYMVNNTAFYTSLNTVLIVDGNKCPNGTTSLNHRCTMDNMDTWVKSRQRFANVTFNGQIATVIHQIKDV